MKLTVFTATYNRGYIIGELYESLKKQTYNDFEWLVIDDGSTDNTEELFKLWVSEESKFQIRYYKVMNGGKHRAINKATDLANGELFFIVDSDDYLVEDALETVVKWEGKLQGNSVFCGVSGNKGKSENEIWGTTFEGEYLDATSLERKEYKIDGDKAEVFYTHILKEYKFDEYEGEKFLTERTVWDRMAYDGYKIRWFNKIIYVCDYLEDGLTKSGDDLYAENPQGTSCIIKQQIKFYNYNIKERISCYNSYYNLVKRNIGLTQAAKYLEIPKGTLVWAIILVKCKNLLLFRT
ncbi:glycosyltransferase family 2 protein [Bacillus luti]|uniref:glycosyltransferase family 2 protein n=1 Tax=Bacillus luti TaxID=2026191 RepID=UPI0012E722E8|nr:glycosyltransferase family A protein [Bacillus luti]